MVQALTGFHRWIGSGHDPGELAELCRAGLLKGLPEAGAVYSLAPFLRYQKQGVGAGKEHGELVPADEQTQSEDVLRAQLFSKSLGELVHTGAEVSLKSLAEGGIRFLETWVPLSREHSANGRGCWRSVCGFWGSWRWWTALTEWRNSCSTAWGSIFSLAPIPGRVPCGSAR